MDIRQIVEETLVAPMRAMASRPQMTVTQERRATEFALNEIRVAAAFEAPIQIGPNSLALVLKHIDRLQMLADAYTRVSSKHEDMVSVLLNLLDNDELDTARDLVKAEHLSIHGPSD